MATQIIAEISVSDLTDFPAPSDATITELEHLASYNWLEKPVPTISVPGCPPLWCPPSVPPKLRPDSGMVYIDQNAARNPSSPLEPLFRALFAHKPDFDIGNIDLVTDRNNIRKLLRFVKSSSKDAFQIGVEIVGNKTALFTRKEDKTTETIQGFKGFGHNFETAYTKKPIGSTGHHRIVSYNFGGMRCIVRHETDGYIDDTPELITAAKTNEVDDSLLETLGTLSLSESEPASNDLPAIAVQFEGRTVDDCSTLEIKTRAASRELDMDEISSQLWISQTPSLVVAYHRQGAFKDIRIRNMKPEIRSWEANNSESLSILVRLIKKIVAVVKNSVCSDATIEYDGGTRLKVITGKKKRTLPDDLYLKWKAEERNDKSDEDPKVTEKKAESKETKDKAIESTEANDKPSQPPTTTASSRTTIRIGDVRYDIELSKIPYLESFVGIRGKAQQSEEVVHDPIPLFDAALRGIESGYRQCFRSIPSDLSQYRILCDTYDFLGVDVAGGQSITDIINDLKSGKTDYELEYTRYREVKGDKSKARDAAFKLLHSMLRSDFKDKVGDAARIFNAVLFVVSHPGTFKSRARTMVRAAYEDRFMTSPKQKARLDQWTRPVADEETDKTTEDEGFLSQYDSDDSDFW